MRRSSMLVTLLAAFALAAPASAQVKASPAPPLCNVLWNDVPLGLNPAPLDAGEVRHGNIGCYGSSPITVTLVSGPAHGVLSALTPLGGPPLAGGARFSLTPDPAYRGPDEFVVRVTDGTSTVDTTIKVTIVDPTNAMPFCDDFYFGPAAGRQVEAGTTITVRYVCGDPEFAKLPFTLLAPPAHGTAIIPAPDEWGAIDFTYTPDASYSGPDQLTVRVVDGPHVIDKAIKFDVTPAKTPPPVVDEQPRVELPAPARPIDQLVLSSAPSVTNVSALDKRIAKVCGKLKGSRKTTCAKRERALAKCGAMKAKTRTQKAAKTACTKRAKLIGAKPAKGKR